MRLLIVSDVHGDFQTLDKIIKKESFDELIILGDLFSYGYYSNEYKEENIINLLEKYKNKLILIKGNCDNFINYNAINIRAFDRITIPFDNHLFTFTHGHKYKKSFLSSFHGDVFISGHTHIPSIIKENSIIYANPGSISIPRGGSPKCYLVFNNNKPILKTINNEIIKEMTIS